MYFKSFFILFLLFLYSCSNIEFVYDGNYNYNIPLYNKTYVKFEGAENPSLYQYSSKYFGKDQEGAFELYIKINEEKTKRAVQTNQAVSKLDYKLTYSYELFSSANKCLIFKKTISSKFSIEPKSSGYNFGSDKSLERLYELAVKSNIQNFIDLVTIDDISKCLDES